MAQLICPTCHQPSDNGYCLTCMTSIPEPEPEPEDPAPIEDARLNQQVASDAYAEIPPTWGDGSECCDPPNGTLVHNGAQVACQACGMLVPVGAECPQCGTIVAAVHPNAGLASERKTHGCVVLPDGQRVEIPIDEDCVIGRESPTPQIRYALENRCYVSRQHCIIRINSRDSSLLIIDEGSLNGTFIGNERIKVNHRASCPLPTRVWLGSQVSIDVYI